MTVIKNTIPLDKVACTYKHTHTVSFVASDTRVDLGVIHAKLATSIVLEHHHAHTVTIELGRKPSLGGYQLFGLSLLCTIANGTKIIRNALGATMLVISLSPLVVPQERT